MSRLGGGGGGGERDIGGGREAARDLCRRLGISFGRRETVLDLARRAVMGIIRVDPVQP